METWKINSEPVFAFHNTVKSPTVEKLVPAAWRYKPREGVWAWQYVTLKPVDDVNYIIEPLYTITATEAE